MFRPLSIFLIAVFSLSDLAVTQEKEPAENEKDWLEFYYENPSPDRVVSEIKKFAREGTLANEQARPVLIAFLSQVFRKHRERIPAWHRELKNLKAADLQVINTALLYSRTSEADDLLRPHLGAEYDQQKAQIPKILEMNLAQKTTFDMLWGFFYATGSENAIRRVVFAFQFEDAPDNPNFAKIPKGYQPLYKQLPDAAEWMLKTNSERHPRIVEIMEKIYTEGKELSKSEKRRLEEILTELNPEKFRTEPQETPDQEEPKTGKTAA